MTDKEKAIELHEALRKLVEKLEEVHNSPEFKSVWTMYMVHGCEYDGPNYGKELEHAQKVLKIVQESA